MVIYRHTQVGTIVLLGLGFGVAVCAVALSVASVPVEVLAAVIAVMILCMILFGTLTAEVTEDRVTVWFGPGLIRKSFPIERINSAQPVRNRWYYGWGIRLTPQGWMFNVSGLDAVELELTNGRRFRIGTDEPGPLAEAIEQARGLTKSA